MQTYFLTGNKGKFDEVAASISGLIQISELDVPEIQSIDLEEIITEKLKYAIREIKKKKKKSKYNLIIEDTGLYLGALNQFPGPLIKFMLAAVGSNGIYNICNCLGDYKAKAVTMFGLYSASDDEISFYSGEVLGKIVAPKGEQGFGWDAIFKPNGAQQAFAEMDSIDLKNQYSMRHKALKRLIIQLETG